MSSRRRVINKVIIKTIAGCALASVYDAVARPYACRRRWRSSLFVAVLVIPHHHHRRINRLILRRLRQLHFIARLPEEALS